MPWRRLEGDKHGAARVGKNDGDCSPRGLRERSARGTHGGQWDDASVGRPVSLKSSKEWFHAGGCLGAGPPNRRLQIRTLGCLGGYTSPCTMTFDPPPPQLKPFPPSCPRRIGPAVSNKSFRPDCDLSPKGKGMKIFHGDLKHIRSSMTVRKSRIASMPPFERNP